MARRSGGSKLKAVFPNPTERGLGKQGDFGSDGLCRSAFHDRGHHRECQIGASFWREGPLSRLRLESLRYQGRGPIDLVIESGECVGLFGPSGSGKTLLLRALADLDPHAGRVFLDEVESLELDAPAWRLKVGLLPAESQWWQDTVGQHFPPEEAPWLAWLEHLGLGRETMAWPVTRLSTGERQRLAIVRLLVNRPQVLLLDEPTASLDPDNVERVERLIGAYREATGAAVLWVSHEPGQIARVAGRGFQLVEGRLRETRR